VTRLRSRARSSMGWLVGLAVGASTSGCFPFWLFFDDSDPPPTAPSSWSSPPSIDAIDIADWPPIGPQGVVRVTASDDRALAFLECTFRNTVFRSLAGTTATVEVSGQELGEGLGQLELVLVDVDGGWAERWVENLLVDLTPPEMGIGKSVLPVQGEGARLEAWVADAWVLGRVELGFQGVTLSHDFEPGYPPTLGNAWDYSLVDFPTSELPAGSGVAQLRGWDAAGNLAVESFELTLDPDPPAVSILAPAADSVVSGAFDVTVAAADPQGGPVWITLWLGGTEVTTGVGPTLVVTLDASEFVPGTHDLEALAVDEAGNQSTRTSVPIVVQEPAPAPTP
jgi:hypothetical protein